ncbi:MAG TPA: hypothetical protein VIH45_00350 [Desulfuromonadaceae bacterium]
MNKNDKALLEAPLTPAETRWAMEVADKLPDDLDLSFEEAKILTRIPAERWPKALLAKVREVIAVGELKSGASADPHRR